MSHDSTTLIIRRRVRHWKTTVSGIAAIVCPIISLFLPPEWAAKLLAASSILAGSGLITAADATASEGRGAVVEVADKFKTRIGRLPLPLLAAVLSVGAAGWLLCGCSSFRSTQRETAPDGSIRETTLKARTFFNARSDLAKLRASTTDKTQGMTIGALGQTADGSNVTTLVEGVVRAAVGAAVKP